MAARRRVSPLEADEPKDAEARPKEDIVAVATIRHEATTRVHHLFQFTEREIDGFKKIQRESWIYLRLCCTKVRRRSARGILDDLVSILHGRLPDILSLMDNDFESGFAESQGRRASSRIMEAE